MKLCSIEGCERESRAKDLCSMHYYRKFKCGIDDMRPESFTSKTTNNKGCKVEGCEHTYFAKGYCRKHHGAFLRNGPALYSIEHPTDCKVEGCQNTPRSKGYCDFHYNRFKKGLSLTATRFELFGGENNPNWKGGVAQYPNHSEMKRVRLRVLKRDNYICVYCGKPTKQTHHKDGLKINHTEQNMATCCNSCNLKFVREHTSKYRRLYGFTLAEMRRAKKAKKAYDRLLKDQRQSKDAMNKTGTVGEARVWVTDIRRTPLLTCHPQQEIISSQFGMSMGEI